MAIATFSCASKVDAPRCGVKITSSMPRRGLSCGVGSFSKTSSAAPDTMPSFMASNKSFSFTMPPLAQFISFTPRFIFEKAVLFTRFFVSFVSGTCTDMKSLLLYNSSRETISTPILSAASCDRYGSYANTFILRPCALSATTLPMLPTPSIPSVLPVISVPSNFFFSHSPFRIEAVAWGIFLARATSMATACSAVVIVFPPGVFITTIPFLVAAAVSILSTPVPALPMTLRLSAASIISAVTFVALLTTRA